MKRLALLEAERFLYFIEEGSGKFPWGDIRLKGT